MRKSHTTKWAISAAVALALVAGCGKKPGFVDPPQGRENDRFPRTYPNTNLDPKPATPDQTASDQQAPVK